MLLIFFQILTILVAMAVAGEAAALAIKIHILKKSESPWVSLKNDLLLALDVVVGMLLVLLAFDGENFPQPVWVPFFASVGLVTHLFRVWEYISGRGSSFCNGRSLFVLDILKLIGLSVILLWSFTF